MEFKIIFYKDKLGNNLIEKFLLELEKSNKVLVSQVRKGIEKLRYRAYHKEPLSKYLELNLWELRVKSGSDILRIIFTFNKGQIVILLHIFIKKQQKTPVNELEIARKRLRELNNKGEK
ncbi:MAG: type II toxin-antitoxin system RelE/ParE family toxin [Microgenomates group bacterium]|jgi:phage-related protein